MALNVKVEPLTPKRKIIDPRVPQRVTTVMRQAGGNLANRMRSYPPARPWTSRPPASGPRAGGRRTGTLGRSWSLRFPGRASFELGSAVPYAGFVEGLRSGPKGKRQTAVMAGRGWQRLDEEADTVITAAKPRLKAAFSNRRR